MDLSGKTLRGYEILERIGDGGFGNVYRAAQPSVNREVAVKVILPEFANQPHFIRRFEAEAQLVARLEHPHIVPLFDYWRDPNGAYLVMRWLPGSLSKRLVDGPLSTTTTLHIVEQIASALVTAHRAGVIHRDIKPDNILLDEVGNAYLVDFGIAKVADHAGDTGEEAFGSPAYMPPEQIMGRKVTAQTDIYALGIVLFEMLAGEHPYKNIPLTELVFRQMESPLPFLGIETIPRDVDMVIQKATSKDPALRHQDALELATDLRRALRGTTTGADTQDVLLLDLPNERNPYKGLRAFDEADAGDFFGRDETVERLLRRLIEQDTNFLAVVGPSGSGKSSVVKAGVLPRIRQNALPGSSNWYIVDMVPGARPMRNLEAALLSVSPTPIDGLLDLLRSDDHGLLRAADSLLASAENQTNLLLVIDQLEEVFTLVELEDVRAQFLDLLYIAATEYASRVWIIVTMRADFIGRPLRYPAFGDLMRRRVEFVLPLSNEGLEMAVIGPARRAALTIEPTLLATVVADLHAEPGALPLLQYALTEIYERRTERTLTLEAYHDIGGITGALARRAEEVYADLEPRQQFITQQVFLRMVTLGEGTEDTRRRVWRSELLSVVEDTINLQFVLDKFGAARLLSFDNDLDTREPTVEVAHEALLREWRRLRDWLAASRNDIRLQRLLAAATNEWEDGKRDRSFLLAGARLSQFQEWAAATTVGLSESESAFLQASVAERAKQETIERRRQARELRLAQEAAEAEKRRTRQLRTFVQALAVGGLVLLVVAGLAAILGITARHNAAEANLRAGIAQALTLAAQAELEASGSSPDRAVLLALEALEQYPYTWQAERALARAVQGNQLRMIYGEHESPVNSAALDPTGLFAVSGDDVGIVRAWSTELEQSVAMFEAHDGAVNEVAFSPANDLIASAGNDGVVRVWSLQENAQVFEGANFGLVNGIAFSQTGELLASVSTEGAIRVWAVPSGNLQLSISEPILRNVQDAAFSPDDSHLLTTQSDAVRIWDLATQQEIFTLEYELISSAQFSPDGGYILTAN